MDILLFSVCNQKLGFELSCIKRVIRAVKVTPLPNAPHYILGVINLHGSIILVINLRNVLGLEEREVKLWDQFIICKTNNSAVAFWVDFTESVLTYTQEELDASNDMKFQVDYLQKNESELNFIDYFIKNEKENGITLIYNLQKLLDFYHVETKTHHPG